MPFFEVDDPQDYADQKQTPVEITAPDVNDIIGDDPVVPGTKLQNQQEYNLADVQGTDFWYPENTVDVRYDYHPGVVVQRDCGDGDPIAGQPSRPGRKVKIHDGYWTKVVQWSFERQNSIPVCPHPDTGNPNEVLIKATIVPAKPLEGPDGMRTWRVSGLYEYELLNGLDGVGPFPTAISPESKAQMEHNVLPAIVFDRSLLASLGHQGNA